MKNERITLWVSDTVFELLKDKKMSCLFTTIYKQKGEDRTVPIYVERVATPKEKNA
jgi:hypothetical protein